MQSARPLSVMRFGLLAVTPAEGRTRRTRPARPPLVLPRASGLDLLEWLGLGRPEFGALSGRKLAPLCRRRLWPLPRNLDPARGDRPRGTLRTWTAQLLQVAEEADEQPVMFG